MSTRGTYKITNNHGYSAIIYCHCDNYLEGAAYRIFKMHKSDGKDRVCKFFRGNADAELMHSHTLHGDTEFRYDLDKSGKLSVTKRNLIDTKDGYDEEWNNVFTGHYSEFTNKYLSTEGFGEPEPYVIMKFKIGYAERYLTLDDVEEELNRKLELFIIWTKKGSSGANYDNLKKEIAQLQEAKDKLYKANDELGAIPK